ncbi:MAG TPA: hypothetical protein DCY02_04600 [Armatimonadetes bacterium]|nr:hypothetical protein [Armatimonadota bacterium]HRD30512.1 phosphotransferase [Fimbriimonadaceae bacterium]HRE92828.1 phosphotransferase [Fimbriimonadaceae bacterium]
MDCGLRMATHAVVKTWTEDPANGAELEVARVIASQFRIPPVATVERFRERGNINLHTFSVVTEDGQPYLLQRLNTDVFAFPDRVMDAMVSWLRAQSSALEQRPELNWTPITLVPTLDGDSCLDFRVAGIPNVWRLMVLIPNSTTFKSLSEVPGRAAQLALAEQVGRGLALAADLTSDLDAHAMDVSLPGYRDTYGYYAQFDAVLGMHRDADAVEPYLPESAEVRRATEHLYRLSANIGDAEAEARRYDTELRPYLDLVQEARGQALMIADGVRAGWLRKTAIHGDTKIDNFLFDRTTLEVKSLVDLDTVMPYTWLADWGDCVRSLCNVAGEKERDLRQVQVDREVYAAVARGFLATATTPQREEIALMVDAVEAIALELGLRFLTDYLRGDNYFMLGEEDPADLNRVRAMVQLTLYERLREARPELEALFVERLES